MEEKMDDSSSQRNSSPQATPSTAQLVKAERDAALFAVQENGFALEDLSAEFRNDRAVVLTAVASRGASLKYASEWLRGDLDIVLAAVTSHRQGGRFRGFAMEHVSDDLKGTKDVVLAAVNANGFALKYASDKLKIDMDVVLAAVNQNGFALQYVCEILQGNKEVVKAAVKRDGLAIRYAALALRSDKAIFVAACSTKYGYAFEYASDSLKEDREFVMELVSKAGDALKYASESLRSDKEIVMIAAKQLGYALQYASPNLLDDKDVVLAAVSKYGRALEYASERLRKDKEVVLVAVSNSPHALKFALDGLNQDKKCLIASKLWDPDYTNREKKYNGNITRSQAKIVLSTRFSLDAKSTSTATQFTLRLKEHPFFRDLSTFVVYSPNAFNKDTCDPDWTNIEHPCRGTFETCQKENALKTGIPKPCCCWRYSFRYHLQDAKQNSGFMLQVVDFYDGQHSLGKGQEIETELAREVGTKVFRIFQPLLETTRSKVARLFQSRDIKLLVPIVKQWYADNCKDRKLQKITCPFY